MKNAPNLLVVFLIILNSSCAFAVGQRRCESPDIPVRPLNIICISNASGIGQCYNPSSGKNEVRSMDNYVCKDISDFNRQEEWIEQVLESCK